MIVLAALVVLVLGGVVLAAALSGGGEDRGHGRRAGGGLFGGAGPAMALLVGVGVLVVLFVLPLLLFGLRGGGGEDDSEGPPEPPAATSTTTTTSAPAAEPATREREPARSGAAVSPLYGPEVEVESDDRPGFLPPPPAVGELDAGTVLRVRVGRFPPDVTGEVIQCLDEGGRLARCRNAFPVRFDELGRARFQYLVVPLPGGCRLRSTPCVVVVQALEGEVSGAVRTVFEDPAPVRGAVALRPRTGIDDGETVTVSVRRFPAGTTARVVQCAAPATAGPEACGPPGPVATMAIGPDGTGTAELTVRAGPVGTDAHECGRDATCGIAVLAGDGSVVAPVVALSFSGGPAAGYDGLRVAAGLLLAAALLAAAAVLVRRTDWTEPSEAATPEMDATNFEVEDVDLDDEDDFIDA